jgi:hypothetical protein
VKPSDELVALVPPGVVTVIFTVPADSAGDIAVMDVDESTITVPAATPPNITVAPDVKPVPVMATDVPPLVEPVVGDMELTIGGA